jgi:hypothetical protein
VIIGLTAGQGLYAPACSPSYHCLNRLWAKQPVKEPVAHARNKTPVAMTIDPRTQGCAKVLNWEGSRSMKSFGPITRIEKALKQARSKAPVMTLNVTGNRG